MSPITRTHRLAVARAWEGSEDFGPYVKAWLAERQGPSGTEHFQQSLERLAQLVADAELTGAAAQQKLITNTLFGGLIDGPLVDDAIALSQRVNVAKKQECAVAWDEGFQDRQQPTNPYLTPKPPEQP